VSDRPFAPACERNRAPILERISEELAGAGRVLEIGSGTGQHAAWFAPRLPHLTWVASDVEDRLPGIRAWLADVSAPRAPEVLALDVTRRPWPEAGPVDAAFSANTAHILPTQAVEAMFEGLGEHLPEGSPFCLYGPVSAGGRHTGPGNEAFDASLRQQDPRMGIRDLDWLDQVGEATGFSRQRVWPMPADNRLIVWLKR
jgi:SAM-dependent methyltransferase